MFKLQNETCIFYKITLKYGINEHACLFNSIVWIYNCVYARLFHTWEYIRPKGKSTTPVNLLSNTPKSLILTLCMIWKYIPGTTCKNINMSKYVLLNQKLPGELEMAFTTAISSSSLFVAGKRQKTNPSVKMTRRRRPNNLMETWLHFLFLSF